MTSTRSTLNTLFFEIVQMMGIRGYNIQPFKWLIDNRMKNDRLTELGREKEVVEINDSDLIQWIDNYRITQFGLPSEMFKGEKMPISMVFERFGREEDVITTLVIVGNDKDGMTSKDTIVDFITSILKTLTQIKTGGVSVDPFIKSNKVNGIFILHSGVSSYSKTFLNEMSTIKILTEGDVLSRNYDQCLQSHIRIVDAIEKDNILEPVGLNGSKIPAVIKDNDAYCRVVDPRKGDLMIISRDAISSEESLTTSMNFRDIR